jgi:hypothetical protein
VVKAHIYGLTGKVTPVNLKIIRKTDSEYINGQMVSYMKASGKMVYNMAKEFTLIHLAQLVKVNG